jgi:chorismate mutase
VTDKKHDLQQDASILLGDLIDTSLLKKQLDNGAHRFSCLRHIATSKRSAGINRYPPQRKFAILSNFHLRINTGGIAAHDIGEDGTMQGWIKAFGCPML